MNFKYEAPPLIKRYLYNAQSVDFFNSRLTMSYYDKKARNKIVSSWQQFGSTRWIENLLRIDQLVVGVFKFEFAVLQTYLNILRLRVDIICMIYVTRLGLSFSAARFTRLIPIRGRDFI